MFALRVWQVTPIIAGSSSVATGTVYQDVRNRLRDAGEEALVFNSPVQQYLISSGRTLFKGMVYEDLLRLQLDIEATSLDPFAPNARVFLVSVRTSGGEERLFGASGEDEATILDDLTAFIRDADPDIIEGHNIFNYDMPYLLARAAACGRRSRGVGMARCYGLARMHGRSSRSAHARSRINNISSTVGTSSTRTSRFSGMTWRASSPAMA